MRYVIRMDVYMDMDLNFALETLDKQKASEHGDGWRTRYLSAHHDFL
jgi:hypothetical protein